MNLFLALGLTAILLMGVDRLMVNGDAFRRVMGPTIERTDVAAIIEHVRRVKPDATDKGGAPHSSKFEVSDQIMLRINTGTRNPLYGRAHDLLKLTVEEDKGVTLVSTIGGGRVLINEVAPGRALLHQKFSYVERSRSFIPGLAPVTASRSEGEIAEAITGELHDILERRGQGTLSELDRTMLTETLRSIFQVAFTGQTVTEVVSNPDAIGWKEQRGWRVIRFASGSSTGIGLCMYFVCVLLTLYVLEGRWRDRWLLQGVMTLGLVGTLLGLASFLAGQHDLSSLEDVLNTTLLPAAAGVGVYVVYYFHEGDAQPLTWNQVRSVAQGVFIGLVVGGIVLTLQFVIV